MDQDRIYILLARYVANEATSEELEELEQAFHANPDLLLIARQLPEWRQLPPGGISAEEEQQLLERGLQRFTYLRENNPAEMLSSLRGSTRNVQRCFC